MTFHVGWPQLIMIVLEIGGLGLCAMEHGKETKSTRNFWTCLVANVFWMGLLYWGGFFG